jgi:XTP/dITP diphosphohydrolase
MPEPTQAGDMRKLVLASGNPGKLRELGELLHPLGWDIRLQQEWDVEEAVEDGLTFVENALIKARHASRLTGLPSLGDDSGLVVDALDGAPGIYSARFAGEHAADEDNNLKLLNSLRDVPAEQRTAHFYCALTLVRHASDPSPLIATGIWRGAILNQPRGEGGFGYDPLFWLPSHQRASAELDAATKNRLSHRGQALSALVEQLRDEHLE